MTEKVVYSVFREEFAYPRVVKASDDRTSIVEKSNRGSAVSYGKFMDTGIPYASIDDLEYDRYRHYQKGDFVKKGSGRGWAWMVTNEDNTVWSVFGHKVNRPGVHYIVEWKHRSKTTQQPYNEDYSPLYTAKEDAEKAVEVHMNEKIKKLVESGKAYKELSEDNRYSLTYGKLSDNYQVIPILVTEEVFQKASEEIEEGFYIEEPWIHFQESEQEAIK